MQPFDSAPPARVLIADDHPLVRESLLRLVNQHSELDVVGEAEDGQEVLELCRRLRPDVVLMDIRMPKMDGLEATGVIKREFPRTIVLMLTAFENPDYLLEALKAGASGYILKEASAQQITNAIHQVLEGESALNQEVAMLLFKRLIDEKQQQEGSEDLPPSRSRRPSEGHSDLPPVEPLTPRELELLRLMKHGQTNQQIAQNLSISVSTVKNHVHHIISKLGASDRVQAVALAIEHGLVVLLATEFIEPLWLVEL